MRSFFCRAQKGCALNTRGSTQLVASILIRDGWTGLDKTTTGLAVYRAPAEPEFGRGKTIQSWYCYFHIYTLTFFCTSWLHENSWKTMQEWHISCLAGKTGSLLISYYHQTCFRRKETCSSYQSQSIPISSPLFQTIQPAAVERKLLVIFISLNSFSEVFLKF